MTKFFGGGLIQEKGLDLFNITLIFGVFITWYGIKKVNNFCRGNNIFTYVVNELH